MTDSDKRAEECLDTPPHVGAGAEQQHIHQLDGGIHNGLVRPAATAFSLKLAAADSAARRAMGSEVAAPPYTHGKWQRQRFTLAKRISLNITREDATRASLRSSLSLSLSRAR
jgi:hypothetical protein